MGLCLIPYLVSTHVVCERLFAMRGLPEYGMEKFMLILPRIPIPILTTQEYPLPIEIWPELGTLSSHYPRMCGD